MAGGFDVGKAFIQVVPSFEGAQDAINRFVAQQRPIDVPAKVDSNALSKDLQQAATKAAKDTQLDFGKAKADFSDIDRKLNEVGRKKIDVPVDANTAPAAAKIDELGKGKNVNVGVDADTALADAKLRELTTRQIAMLAKVDADLSAARAKLAELQASTPKIGVDLAPQTAALEAKIAALEAKQARIQVQVDGAATAVAELDEVSRKADEVDGKNANINVESSSASRAIGIMGLLTAGIAAAGYAAPAAAAAIAAIPAAISVAGQGVGALVAGFSGISTAVKAFQTVDDATIAKSTANNKRREASINGVEQAQSALEAAQTRADRASITGAEQVQAARDALARAQENVGVAQEAALRRVQSAEQALATAQQSARDAQLALSDARTAAVDRLNDLKLSLAGAALSEEAASIALEKAQANLQKLKDAGVTGLQLREADLGARQAVQSLAEVRARYQDIQTAAAYAAKTGVEGDSQVMTAQRQVRDTTLRVQAAELAVTQARVDGARQVATAQDQVAKAAIAVSKAQQAASFAQADATKAVADAQRHLADATEKAALDSSVATDKLHLALSKLGPEARSFANMLQREVKPALIGLSDATQAAMLPQMEQALRTLLQLTPFVSKALADTGRVIGDLALQGAQMVTSGPWKRDFATIAQNNVDIIRQLGFAGLSVADAFRNIMVASGPMLLQFATFTAKSAEAFANFLEGKRATGELAVWFQQMTERLKDLWGILFTVGKAIWDLAAALAPFGGALLHIIEWLAQMISNFSTAYPFITQLIAGLGLAATALILFGRSVTGIVGAFSSGLKGINTFKEGLTNTVGRIDNFANRTGKLGDAVSAAAHPMIATSLAASSLSAAYSVGADRTRAWMTAHEGAFRPIATLGTAIGTAAANAARLGDSITTNVTGAAAAVGAAASRASDAIGSRFVPAALHLSDTFATTIPAAVARASDAIGSRFVPAALSLADHATNAASATAFFGQSLRNNVVIAAETARSSVLSFGTALANAGDTSRSAMNRIATGIYDAGTTIRTGMVRAGLEVENALNNTSAAAGRFRDAVQTGFNRASLEGSAAATRLGETIRSGLGNAISSAGSSISSGMAGTLRVFREGFTGLGDTALTTATTVKRGLAEVGIAAGGTANALKSGLQSAIGGISGALGGPWTIAVTGAVLALGLFTSASEAAAKSSEAHLGRVQSLTGALIESKGAIDTNVRAQAANALTTFKVHDGTRNFLNDVQTLAGPEGVRLLTDAYLGNGDAMATLQPMIQTQIDQLTAQSFSTQGLNADQGRWLDSLIVLQRHLKDPVFQEAAQNAKNQAAAIAGVADKTQELSVREQVAKETTTQLNEKFKIIADTTRTVAERGQAIIDFLDTLKGKAPGVDEAVNKINEGLRKLTGGFTDASGNVIKFNGAVLDAAGKIDTTTQAGSDLRGVVRTLAAEMASVGQAAFNQALSLHKTMPEAYKAAHDAMLPYLDKVKEGLHQNGFTEEQIARLLHQYNLVPGDIVTTMKLSGDKVASDKVAEVIAHLQQLPPDTPFSVTALTGNAEEGLLALGYHIVSLPDGSFKVFSNTAEGQKQADDFVARNNGRAITMEAVLKTQQAEADLVSFKERNKTVALTAVLTNSGQILYETGEAGWLGPKIHIAGKNLGLQARGGILEFFANGGFGGLSAMSPNVASIVPPNTMRVIGDRAQGDEAFIPINREPRSVEILSETAYRMGFTLSPMALGGILALAAGAVLPPAAAAAPAVPVTPTAATPEQLTALTAAMTAATAVANVLTTALGVLQTATVNYTVVGLIPLVGEVNTLVVPALNLLQQRLPPLQQEFAITTTVVNTSMGTMSLTIGNTVAQIGTYFDALRGGLQATGQGFQSTSDWARDSWARIQGYAADPTRAVLAGPFNAGLISAWNFLDGSFALNKHLNPVPIPFATGGFVSGPGTGTSDSIDAKLSNGEYVIPATITSKVLPFLDALRFGQAEALQAAGYRTSYATGGLVADTGSELNAVIVRGQQWLRQQAGKPYIWGGAGPEGFDCSGLVAALVNVLRGETNPYHRLGTTLTMPWPGFAPGLTSAMAAGWNDQHMAGTLGGVNLEARDFGVPVLVGGSASGADSTQFSGHASLPVVGGKFVSGGGGGFDPVATVTAAFNDTMRMIAQTAALFPGNRMAADGLDITSQSADRLRQIAVDKISVGIGSGAAIGGDAKAAQDYARMALPRFGWGPEQMNSLIPLWNGESNWLWWKINPDSGAGGIPQALPATKMGDVSQGGGPDWRTNPATQINWGLRYIKDRPDYGSPAAAYSQWLSRSPHWYDDGGWLPPGYSTVANHTGRPEAILTQDQWNALSTMAASNITNSRSITVNARTDASPDHIAHTVDRLVSIGTRL